MALGASRSTMGSSPNPLMDLGVPMTTWLNRNTACDGLSADTTGSDCSAALTTFLWCFSCTTTVPVNHDASSILSLVHRVAHVRPGMSEGMR